MWEVIKKYVYGAGALVVAVFAAIFYARGKKIETLEGEVEDAQGQSNLRKELTGYANAKDAADIAEARYRHMRKRFDNGNGSDDSGGGAA